MFNFKKEELFKQKTILEAKMVEIEKEIVVPPKDIFSLYLEREMS